MPRIGSRGRAAFGPALPAVDRARLVELAGGSDVGQLTCQILPPNFPGYRPYCPHTTRPIVGGYWTAPDLARARDLVLRSGTRGMQVDVVTVRQHYFFSSAGAVVADALRRLGYRVSLRVFPDLSAYFSANDLARHAEVAFNAWSQDFPAPSNFITGIFGCSPYYCDRAFARRTQRTLAVQARDPRAAIELWVGLERELVDLAITIPLLNPKDVDFVSKRVGNYQRHPVYGALISQLWVR